MIVRQTCKSPGEVRDFIVDRFPCVVDTFSIAQVITSCVRGRIELENRERIEWETAESCYIVDAILTTPLKAAYYKDQEIAKSTDTKA